MVTRLARCGHEYDAPGPTGPPRKWCAPCAPAKMTHAERSAAGAAARWKGHSKNYREPRPEFVVCEYCGARKATPPGGPVPRWCSTKCNNLDRGWVREPLPPIVCALPGCGVEFVPMFDKQRCCSESHGKRLWHFEAKRDGRVKPQKWTDARRNNYHRRRAVIKTSGTKVVLDDIIKRDKGCCQLCGEKVDLSLKWPDPMSRTLDHIVPLRPADPSITPGTHEPANVQLAHARCNIAKGNRGGGEQLLLVG